MCLKRAAMRRDTDVRDTSTLTLRQRMTLVYGTSLSNQAAAEMEDGAFDYAFFQRHGIRSRNIKVAGINPTQLKARGVSSALELRSLGFGTLDLVDGAFCASCVSAFGAKDLVSAFLAETSDAVTLAGSPAIFQLDLDVATLLMVCAGAPSQAAAVLAQSHPYGACLTGVAPETLLDSGLRAKQLKEMGFTEECVRRQTRATTEQMKKLQF